MKRQIAAIGMGLLLLLALSAASAQHITLATQRHDPFGFPRPGADHTDVPIRTSFYIQIRPAEGEILPDSVTFQIRRDLQFVSSSLVGPNQVFGPNCSGWFRNVRGDLAVYVTRSVPLEPDMKYFLRVTAQDSFGNIFEDGFTIWSFHTEAPAATHPVAYDIDFGADGGVNWQGGFFTGFNKTSFCVSEAGGWLPVYEMMDRVREQFPKAWSFQRDAHPLGSDPALGNIFRTPPNFVVEQETRRILAMTSTAEGVELLVEDIHGHQQYGIASNRPLADDYEPGYEVLIADGNISERVHVIEVKSESPPTILVESFPTEGWNLNYQFAPPIVENPAMPGLFARGGCYLRRFDPHGTAKYYWERINKEYDITAGTYGRRLIVNMRQAPGDMAIDGKNDSPPKDYAQYHETIRDLTGYLIQRYGDAALHFAWSALNEPDLSPYWRFNWNEALKYYDYTIDAVLRAFEDHGYDSSRVFVGGLELGAIGTNPNSIRVHDFLAHCSPTATREGVMLENAAFADPRLDGKRSQRVEELCAANDGKGSPCDFVVIHAYNRSKMMADKMIAAKQIALDIDPVFFENLWINSHESMPSWNPPPDFAARDSFLGNGYLVTWCADVARHLLSRAQEDSRFAFGESILTFWGSVFSNLDGMNSPAQRLSVDSTGNGQKDREETVPLPIIYFAGMLNGMGSDLVVLPEQTFGNHVVSGFSGRTDTDLRVLLYSHNSADTQSRSVAQFEATLNLTQIPWEYVRVIQYRINADENSAFRLIEDLRLRSPALYTPQEVEQIREMTEPRPSSRRSYMTIDGSLQLVVPIASNGANMIILEPAPPSSARGWSIYR